MKILGLLIVLAISIRPAMSAVINNSNTPKIGQTHQLPPELCELASHSKEVRGQASDLDFGQFNFNNESEGTGSVLVSELDQSKSKSN